MTIIDLTLAGKNSNSLIWFFETKKIVLKIFQQLAV
jgi:hypothetical protein